MILFHDAGGDRKQTIKALEKILPELKSQGYQFLTISELLNIKIEMFIELHSLIEAGMF